MKTTRITLEFGGRVYTLKTDDPQDIVEEVKERIEKMLSTYEKDVEEFPREDILFVVLANAVLNQIKMERKAREIIKRIDERIKEWSYESGAL